MIKGVVFDLDGTLYYGDKAVDGAIDTVYALLNAGLKVFYLTNNSGKARQQIVEKLNGLGFPAKLQNTYCCSYATSVYLAEEQITPVYLIGTDGLKSELESRNIRVEDSSDVRAVVVGLDPFFDYGKITRAMEAISNGAKLIIANADPSYPIGGNRRLPGCGAMVGAIVGATGHNPDFIVGKPNTYMLELLCKEHNLTPAEICVLGDVTESDMEMARRFGCQGVLFDPLNAFPEFSGSRVKELPEIITLLSKKGDKT